MSLLFLSLLYHLVIFLALSPTNGFVRLFPSLSSATSRIVPQQQQRSIRLFAFNDNELDLLDYLRAEMIRVTELSKDVYATDRELLTERSNNLDSLFRAVKRIQEMEKDIVLCVSQKESADKEIAAKAASYEREFTRCRAELEDHVKVVLKREDKNKIIFEVE